MIARRAIWADAEVQALLQNFVTVADEVHRLQRGGNAESEMFRSFCEEGHYGGRVQPTSTRQGIYAVAPSGRFLASVNTRSPKSMVQMLERALARWRELGEPERRLGAAQRERLLQSSRFEDRYPADGLVLAEYLRDLEASALPAGDWRRAAWNEDQIWFTKAEARAFVPAAEVGASVELGQRLVERLVCLHLVDSVRGQTSAFRPSHIQAANWRSEVLGIDGDRLRLALSGATAAVEKGRWRVRDRNVGNDPIDHERGVRTELSGRAVWNRKSERFESFELLAIGERWGATQYNGRPASGAPTPVGFAFVLAPAGHPRVAPSYYWQYGW